MKLSEQVNQVLRRSHSNEKPYCGWVQDATISDLPRQIAVLEDEIAILKKALNLAASPRPVAYFMNKARLYYAGCKTYEEAQF